MVYVWLNEDDHIWYTTEDNPQLLDLFGTDTLPTPFSAAMPAEVVLQTLRSKHPERVYHHQKTRPKTKNLFDPRRYQTKAELLEVCVLHVLKDGGRFAFDLNKNVQQLVSETLVPGSLEPVLKKLLLEGLVIREQKQVPFNGSLVWFYEITCWGKQHLKDRVEHL